MNKLVVKNDYYFGFNLSTFETLRSSGVSQMKIDPSTPTDTMNSWLGEITTLLMLLE